MTDEGLTSLSKHRERADCAVRAVAAATGVGYEAAYEALAARGRKPGRGTWTRDMILAIEDLGFVAEKWLIDGKTIRTVERELPETGAFIIWATGHFLARVEGTTYDWAAGRCKRIKEVYEITRKPEPPKRRRRKMSKKTEKKPATIDIWSRAKSGPLKKGRVLKHKGSTYKVVAHDGTRVVIEREATGSKVRVTQSLVEWAWGVLLEYGFLEFKEVSSTTAIEKMTIKAFGDLVTTDEEAKRYNLDRDKLAALEG